MSSNNEQQQQQVMDVVEEAVVVARSSCCEGSKKQSALQRTLSPRKPKSAAKPPKFRTLERSASVVAQSTNSYDAEIAKKVEQQGGPAPKPGMKRLDRLGKFRFRSGHLDFDISSVNIC